MDIAMDMDKTIAALKQKGYTVSYFKTGEEAAAYLGKTVQGKTVGFGDSETMISIGLYDKLRDHNTVYDPKHCPEGEDFYSTARLCLTTDVFFTSVNGMAETGELVNIDGTGNRVAGSLYGHEKVYFIVGVNKIAKTLEDAVWRARNIAAPENVVRHNYRTPCAVKQDHCYDCKSPDRICCAQVIYFQKMRHVEAEIILIQENLGF